MLHAVHQWCYSVCVHSTCITVCRCSFLQLAQCSKADNWAQLHCRSALLLMQHMVHTAHSLLWAATDLQPLLDSTAAGSPLKARFSSLAQELLQRVEPNLEVYRRWPAPEPHTLYEKFQEARMLAAGVEAAASCGAQAAQSIAQPSIPAAGLLPCSCSTAAARSNGSSPPGAPAGQLSMQELLKFLPTAKNGASTARAGSRGASTTSAQSSGCGGNSSSSSSNNHKKKKTPSTRSSHRRY